ncbi:hypothetical protein N9D48_02120 [Gammaproteobacteria bacterium]|nr:hypothetical protein [Gammaproteobacteria bacterium]
MKKLLSVLTIFILFSANASAATYTLYYKSSQYANWVSTGNTFYSEGSCEQSAKSSYSWAYATKCNIDN